MISRLTRCLAPDRHEDRVWTELAAAGASLIDAEPPGLVARRAHDSPVRGTAAPDHDRLAPELRAIALLDGREERVEISVQDHAAGHAPIIRPTSAGVAPAWRSRTPGRHAG
jgi:hypothetical protein